MVFPCAQGRVKLRKWNLGARHVSSRRPSQAPMAPPPPMYCRRPSAMQLRCAHCTVLQPFQPCTPPHAAPGHTLQYVVNVCHSSLCHTARPQPQHSTQPEPSGPRHIPSTNSSCLLHICYTWLLVTQESMRAGLVACHAHLEAAVSQLERAPGPTLRPAHLH